MPIEFVPYCTPLPFIKTVESIRLVGIDSSFRTGLSQRYKAGKDHTLGNGKTNPSKRKAILRSTGQFYLLYNRKQEKFGSTTSSYNSTELNVRARACVRVRVYIHIAKKRQIAARRFRLTDAGCRDCVSISVCRRRSSLNPKIGETSNVTHGFNTKKEPSQPLFA